MRDQNEAYCALPSGIRDGEGLWVVGATIRRRCYFQNGVLDGRETTYWPNGREQSIIHYKQGKQHGERIGFFEDGRVASYGNMAMDHRDGLWLERYPSGALRMVARYVDGFPVGVFELFLEDGRPSKKLEYIFDGKCSVIVGGDGTNTEKLCSIPDH